MLLFNVNQYLELLELQVPAQPDLDFLCKLQFQHLHKIPFENLNLHLGIPIVLDLDYLFQKIVLDSRGGFCYELNGLLSGLLQALGYECWLVSARVFESPRRYSPAFDHMAIIVKIEGELYLADVGFGDFSLRPIHLKEGATTGDGNNHYLVDRYYSYYRINLEKGEQYTPEYILKTKAMKWQSFLLRCRYHEHDPRSHFQKGPVITVLTSSGRITLTDQKFKRQSETRIISDHTVFASLLNEHFKLSWITLQEQSRS